jgi:hypothetical protein
MKGVEPVDAHLLPLHLSRACAIHSHAGCPETGCGCGCHKRCSHCGRDHEATFNVSQVIGSECLVCGECYTTEFASRWHKRCEDCGSTEAFCESSVGAVYLCLNCHHKRDLRRAPRLAS